MFAQHERNKEAIEKALEVFRSHGPEDVIAHEELEAATGLERGETYYRLIRRARELYCSESGTWSREVNGVGYRLLSAEESLTEEQWHRRKKARRQMTVGVNVAEAVPDNRLTDHQRRLKAHVLESHAKLRKELLSEERQEKWLLKPPSDKPVRVVPPRIVKPTGTE